MVILLCLITTLNFCGRVITVVLLINTLVTFKTIARKHHGKIRFTDQEHQHGLISVKMKKMILDLHPRLASSIKWSL